MSCAHAFNARREPTRKRTRATSADATLRRLVRVLEATAQWDAADDVRALAGSLARVVGDAMKQ